MMRRSSAKRLLVSLLVSGVDLVFVGCLGRSPDVHHFVLGTHSSASSARAPELAVLIGPVRLPNYLDRPQIARRGAGGEIELDSSNRWLGGFEANLTTALAADLRRQLGSVRVVAYPSQAPFPIDFSVRIHVDEWIVDELNVLQVKLRWAITDRQPEPATELAAYEAALTVDGRSVEALVAAHDIAIAALAATIADQLVTVAGAEVADVAVDAVDAAE